MRLSPRSNTTSTAIALIALAMVICGAPFVQADDRGVAPAQPQVISVSPDDASGLRQEFRFKYADSFSRALLARVTFLIGDSKDDGDALFVSVELDERKMRLGEEGRFTSSFVDDGIIGEAKTLSSRHVDINLRLAQRLNTGERGIDIIVTLDFSGRDFRGRKNIYMNATDVQDISTEFLLMGQYTIEGPASTHAPRNIDVTPDNNSGKRQSFRIRVRDEDGVTDINDMIVVFAKNDNFRSGVTLIMHVRVRTEEIDIYNAGEFLSTSTLSSDRSVSKYFTVHLENTRILRAPPEDGVRKVLQFHPDIQFKSRALGEWKIYSFVADSQGRTDGFERLGKYTVPGGRVGVRGLYTIPGNSRGPYDDGISDRIPQKFVCVWYDTDGQDDIRWLQFKVSPNADKQDDIFHFAIDLDEPTRPTVILWNDLGVPGASSRIGRTSVLSNSQGSVDMRTFELTPLGSNQYRAEFEVKFDRSFRGAQNIYMRGEDFADNRSPWRKKGKYLITNNDSRPGVDSIRPVFDSGTGTRFVFRWTDPDGPNDIKFADVWFGPRAGVDGVRLTYDHARNRIELAQGGSSISAGVGAPIGRITMDGITAVLDRVYVFKEGDELVLSIEVQFNPAQMSNPGFNLIHLRSRDFRGQESRWFARGSYTATGGS